MHPGPDRRFRNVQCQRGIIIHVLNASHSRPARPVVERDRLNGLMYILSTACQWATEHAKEGAMSRGPATAEHGQRLSPPLDFAESTASSGGRGNCGRRRRLADSWPDMGRLVSLDNNQRAKVEASIGRYKRVIGNALRSRTDRTEATEVALAAAALNRMLAFGRPNYVRIA